MGGMSASLGLGLRVVFAVFFLLAAHMAVNAAGRLIGLGSDACGTPVSQLPKVIPGLWQGTDAFDDPALICRGMKTAFKRMPAGEDPAAFLNAQVSDALASNDTFTAKSWVDVAPDVLGGETAEPETFLVPAVLEDYADATGYGKTSAENWLESFRRIVGGAVDTFRCERDAPSFEAFAGAVATDLLAIGDIRDLVIYGCADLRAGGGENPICSAVWNSNDACAALPPDRFILSLSTAGLAASAFAATGVGTAAGAPTAAGASVLKLGKKGAKLDTPLGAKLSENVTGLVDVDGVMPILEARAGGPGRIASLFTDGAARSRLQDDLFELVDSAKLRALRTDLDDVVRISDEMGGGPVGVYGAYKSLDYMKTPDDLAAMRQLSRGERGSSAFVLSKRAGDAATALRIVKAAYRANLLAFLALIGLAILFVFAAVSSLFAPRNDVNPF